MPSSQSHTLVLLASALLLFVHQASLHAEDAQPPQTVQQIAEDFDPRQYPLDAQVVREWTKEGIVYRYVTYHVGTFKGQPARMAGYFAFPEGAKQVPAVLHLHGGGQRAFLHEAEFYAKRGYACLSINWGGREMENAQPGEPNTDWGAVDPTQNNVPGYANLLPGEKYLDPAESPRNNNWYLLTLAARRGLTFLEQQSEVDANRLGVYGHSMGGNLTVYVAGTDSRVKAAAPSVGGSGFRYEVSSLLPQEKKQLPSGNLQLFNATLGFESYAPRIKAPLLWLGATNDFHGIMDDTYRTGALIPHANVRYSFMPHMNHRFTPAFSVTRPLWFDQHLKETFTFPSTPQSKLLLDGKDSIAEIQVTPDASKTIEAVHIYYSIDPDPRARFWRSASAQARDGVWGAKLPILSTDQPLFAFENVHYALPTSESEPHARPTQQFARCTMLHTATPQELQQAKVRPTDSPSLLIEDFSHAWQDWYLLEAGNPHHWEFSTRKLSDPKWQGEAGRSLVLELKVDKPNELVIVLTENFFRSYRGKTEEYFAVLQLQGGPDPQVLSLTPSDFQSPTGQRLASWQNIDILSLRAYYQKGEKLVGSKQWQGPLPQFQKLHWK